MKKWLKLMRNGRSIGNMFGDVAKKATKWGLGIATAAVTAATAIGGMAVNTTQEINKATDSFIASTGEATEKTEQYNQVLGNIYRNNYGEDFQDIADSMAQVKTQLGEINDTELQNVTEDALALRDTFGFEVNESVRAAKMLMDQFGISSSEAYNLIAQGAQQGLDKNGDLLDSINEYSVQFNKLGLSAEDMFNIFQSGSDAGAWNLDKIGDAVKEFSIRAIDGSNTTIEGFTKLGMNADEMAQKFAAGGDTAKEAFYETIDAIKAMDDPVQQSIVGVDLFGTMWEDLGPEVITQLGSIREGYDQTADSMNKIKAVKYDDIGSMFEGLKRNVEMLLLPLGNALMPAITAIMNLILNNIPLIEGLITQLTPIITQLFTALMPPIQSFIEIALPMFANLIDQVLPIFIELLTTLLPPVMQIVEALLPVFVELIQLLLPPLIQIIQMLLPMLLTILEPLLPLLQPIIALLQPVISLLMNIVTPLVQLVNMILPPIVTILTNIISFIFLTQVNYTTLCKFCKENSLILLYIQKIWVNYPYFLFPFNSCRRLRCYIINYSIYMLNFINNSFRYFI